MLFLPTCCLSTVYLLATKWFYNFSCLSCAACTVPVIGRTLTLPAISNAKLAKQVYVKLDPKCLGIEACLDIPLNIPVSPSVFLFFSFVSFILKLFGFHEKCESAPCKDHCRSRRQKRWPACRLTATCFRELCYVYAVARQISMLFIDNKDSVLFCSELIQACHFQ